MLRQNLTSPVLVLLGVMLGSSVSSIAHAGMYKYTDENGNVVYSQTPPPSGDYQSVKIPKEARKQSLTKEQREAKKSKARESILGKDPAKGEDEADNPAGKSAQKNDKDILKEEAKKNRKERAKLCETARENKRKLEVFRRFKDKDGNVTRMDDKERERRLKNANDAIKQFCS